MRVVPVEKALALMLLACACVCGQPKTAVSGTVTTIGKLDFVLQHGRLKPSSVTAAPGTYIIRLYNGYLLGTDIPFGLSPQSGTAQGAATGSTAALPAQIVANTLAKNNGRSQVVVTLTAGAYTLVVGVNSQWKSTISITAP
jgi:hypothetical protein